MSHSLVVAFGGNAIMPSGQRGTLAEQRANVRHMSKQLGRLIVQGHHVVVTHGNGPQVGELMLRSDIAQDTVPPLTLDVAGAMTQGQIGYMLQQEIANILEAHGRSSTVCSLITQVLVDRDDPAFRMPTKPIGRFYTQQESLALRDRGWDMVEDAGRGYRRVVPSPRPRTIIEWPAVKALAEAGVLVVAAGGGGVPVIADEAGLRGVEAVIDKDFAAAKLAALVGAETLILLTEVRAVAIDFATPNQRALGRVSEEEMQGYLADGQFPPGSMGPKVQSAIQFLEEGGERAIITSPDCLVDAVNNWNVGTQVLARVPGRHRTSPVLSAEG